MVYKKNKWVFHGKEDNHNDFFFMYTFIFYKIYVQVPFNNFHMNMLKNLNNINNINTK